MESAPPTTDDGSTSSSLAAPTDAVGASKSHSKIEQPSASMPPSGTAPNASVDVEIAPQQGASTLVTKGDEPASLELDPRDDMVAQLQREMEKRRPDRFLIGVLCRSLGGVPSEHRTKIWKELLGVARNERLHLDQSILEVEEDLVNQRVVAADASRTRGNDALFKLPATQETIGKILTFYCKSRSIRYKQGMNEVLAPFLLLEQPRLPEGVVYQLFYAMIDKFLPHVFVDRDFKSLQCSFQLFRLLMLYHDPKLCNYLDQHAMTPELYVTPWFMTLFARGLSQELVLLLWDFFLLHDDPYLLHYVAYALVETHRDAILQADVAMLPQVLTAISLDSRERVEDVCAAALELMETTPRSYRRDLYSVCYGGYTNAMVPFLRQLMGASSMQVYPDELLSNLLSRLGQNQGLNASPAAIAAMGPPLPQLVPQKSFSAERNASLESVFFIVLDCRPLEQYKACHLSLSYHVDPDIVGSPDALSVLLKGFTRMKGCHFCFVGPTVAAETKQGGGLGFEAINRITRGLSGEKAQIDAAAAAAAALSSNSSLLGVGTNTVPFLKKEHITVTRLVLMFLQKGFEHVSRLDGGFEELKLEIEKLDQFAQDQLLVYEEVVSVEAPTAAPLSTEKSATGGLKSFAKKALDRVRTLSDDDATSAIVNSDAGVAIKTKTKATVTTISQRLQILTSAAKDAVTSSTAGKVLQSPPPPSSLFKSVVADERGLVGEEEWMEVYTRTREALEKSSRTKEVVFQNGSLGILFQRSRHKRYLTVVDSLVPESQASESQQVEPGDLLVAVNGEDIAGVPFQDVIDMIKDARRPLVLRLQNVSKKSLDTFDAISIPPLPPILISASHHSLCLSWNKLSLPDERYQLQYAKQSDYNFNPWVSVPMKHPDQSTSATPSGIDRTSGITSHHNGTLVGLEPGMSLVFRVRCGNKEKWGPYSLSSSPMTTLEKGEEEAAATISASEASVTSPTAVKSPRVRTSSSSSINSSAAVFLPGECPEFFERGTFYFRVVAGLRARATPAFDGEKLDIILEKGTIIKCSERLVVSSTNQIFVRLCPDWNVAAQRKAKTVSKKKDSGDDDRRSISASASASEDADEFQAWAFENTPEGACVLERIPEFTDDMLPAAAVPLQEQAKSLVSSFLSASGLKTPASGGTSTSSTTSSSSAATASPSSTPTLLAIATAPRIVGVAAASSSEIKVTWEPVTDLPSRIARYQIQYAKNRLTASWVTLKQDISAETCTYTLSGLAVNVAYVFRVRAADAHHQWGPFSETSEPCKTMEEAAVVVAANKPTKEEPPTDEATTPRGIPPARDEAEMIENATAQERTSSTGFSSFFVRSTSSSAVSNSASQQASQPLRTGSTLLDKAVAAASKLTLTRSDSGRRRRSSAAIPPPTVEEMLEIVLPTEGDLVEVDTWKQAVSNVDASSRSFSSVRYIPTIVVVAPSTEPSSVASSSAKDIDPFAAIATSKAVAIDSVDPSVLESSSSQLTWNRVGDRELVVTRTALIALAKPSSHADAPDAVVETRRSLSALAKITSKKTVPNSVVFHFKREQLTNMEKVAREAGDEDDATAPLEQLCFVVEDKAACVALVKENYSPDDST